MDLQNRQLLLLGLLRIQTMHGYQLNQFLEEHLDFMTSLKPSTAYYTLERMAAEGLVEAHAEQAGNRPTRQIYAITPAGEIRYRELLRRNLASYDPCESADAIGIAFLADLPPEEARQLLAEKRALIQDRLDKILAAEDRVDAASATHLSLERVKRQHQLDLEWLSEVEAWLERALAQEAEPGSAPEP